MSELPELYHLVMISRVNSRRLPGSGARPSKTGLCQPDFPKQDWALIFGDLPEPYRRISRG
jgi:hypothetical protein